MAVPARRCVDHEPAQDGPRSRFCTDRFEKIVCTVDRSRWYKSSDKSIEYPRYYIILFNIAESHRNRILGILGRQNVARLSEILATGATATAVSRLEQEGTIVRLSRGLYQLAGSPLELHQPIVEAAKLVPKGVICLVSALSYHELTDKIPRRVWVAIGPKAWRPHIGYPPVRFVRFSPEALTRHIDTHLIEGVEIRITNPARTIVDLFRYRTKISPAIAIAGLKEALRSRRTTPAEIHNIAAEMKQWRVIQPYLEALSSNGC